MKKYLAGLVLVWGIQGLSSWACADSVLVDELVGEAIKGDSEVLVALRQQAEQGDLDAQLSLGNMYLEGLGCI